MNVVMWLVGKEVAQFLRNRDTANALENCIDEEDKLSRRFAYTGQSCKMYIINNSGLYSLILSNKLSAEKYSSTGDFLLCCLPAEGMGCIQRRHSLCPFRP